MEQFNLGKQGESYKLFVGDRLVIKDGLFEGLEIVYAGKPTMDAFSLIYTERELLSTRIQGNFFFPTDKRELNLGETRLEVLAVDADSITLKEQKREF